MALDLKILEIPAFYIFLALSLVLPRIPVIGKFFSIINTGIHELGHAIMTLLLDGHVIRIELHNDTSGTTASANLKSKLSAFFVAISGYTAASGVAFLAAHLVDIYLGSTLLIGLSMIFFVMLLFWVRNFYGVVWIVIFCTLNCYLLYTDSRFINYFGLFYATMMLSESFFSTIHQLAITIKKPDTLCDATNLSKITRIPSVIWALLFVAFSGFCCYMALLS